MKNVIFIFIIIIIEIIFFSCGKKERNESKEKTVVTDTVMNEKSVEIPDCNYTFEEAIAGSEAPEKILKELVLLDVKYYSTDNKIHRGQVVVNRKIAQDIVEIFEFMLKEHFPVYQVVPIVRYYWDDKKSMAANNSSGFCYRNVSNSSKKSKHSTGMAIDINPFFNPIRYKSPYQHKPNVPEGAKLDINVPGTLTSDHPVVRKFQQLGFRWGHRFKKYFDDHHFDK